MTVRDTSGGIHSEVLHNLFSRFMTKSFEGIHLRLYISKYIVEADDCEISAENNNYGNGATFSFSLSLFE